MADYLGDELARLLDEYDEKRRAVLAREQKGRDDDARFVARFAELRRGVIRPAFERAAALLAERGHKVSITEQEYSVDTGSKVTEAGISIHIAERALSISTRHYNKTVSISTGKPLEGAKGSHSLEHLDRRLVEEELVGFVAGIVAG